MKNQVHPPKGTEHMMKRQMSLWTFDGRQNASKIFTCVKNLYMCQKLDFDQVSHLTPILPLFLEIFSHFHLFRRCFCISIFCIFFQFNMSFFCIFPSSNICLFCIFFQNLPLRVPRRICRPAAAAAPSTHVSSMDPAFSILICSFSCRCLPIPSVCLFAFFSIFRICPFHVFRIRGYVIFFVSHFFPLWPPIRARAKRGPLLS